MKETTNKALLNIPVHIKEINEQMGDTRDLTKDIEDFWLLIRLPALLVFSQENQMELKILDKITNERSTK